MGRRVLTVREYDGSRERYIPYCSTTDHPVGRVMESKAEAVAFCIFFDACARAERLGHPDILGPNTITADDAWRAFCERFGLRFIGDDDLPIYDDCFDDARFDEDDNLLPSFEDEWRDTIPSAVLTWDYRCDFALRKVSP